MDFLNVLSAAIVVAFMAPVFRRLLWGLPPEMLSWGQGLRPAFGAFLFTIGVGGVLMLAMPSPIAALNALGAGTFLNFISARRDRHERGVMILVWNLGNRYRAEKARDALLAKLDYLATKLPADHHAELARLAAGPMTARGFVDDAITMLSRVELAKLDPRIRQRHGQALSTCQLQAGDLEGAGETLAGIERPAEPEVERWVLVSEALLAAVLGNVEDALSAYERAKPTLEGEQALAATYAVVRAHALACRGDDDDAREALIHAKEIAGETGIKAALKPVGPATDLARELLEAEASQALEAIASRVGMKARAAISLDPDLAESESVAAAASESESAAEAEAEAEAVAEAEAEAEA